MTSNKYKQTNNLVKITNYFFNREKWFSIEIISTEPRWYLSTKHCNFSHINFPRFWINVLSTIAVTYEKIWYILTWKIKVILGWMGDRWMVLGGVCRWIYHSLCWRVFSSDSCSSASLWCCEVSIETFLETSIDTARNLAKP